MHTKLSHTPGEEMSGELDEMGVLVAVASHSAVGKCCHYVDCSSGCTGSAHPRNLVDDGKEPPGTL